MHISNVHAREEFRHHSYLSDVAVGVIAGLGTSGYDFALAFALAQKTIRGQSVSKRAKKKEAKMDLRKIKKLIELVEESGVAELEVSSGDESIRISMTAQSKAQAVEPAPVAVPPTASGAQELSTQSAMQTMKAPMAGVFISLLALRQSPL